MTDQDEKLHAELLAEFRRYFELNQVWINTATKVSAIRLRQSLSEIRRICSARRVVIRDWSVEKEAELLAKNNKRKAQKQQAKAPSSDT